MTSVFRSGATALITGGASGIGFAFAQLCRSHGMHLALVDINSEYLTQAKDILGAGKNNQKTETYQVDVSNISDWQKLRTDVESKFGGVDLLMLNAGASFKPQEGKQTWEDIDYFFKTFAINLRGTINGISTFLPTLQSPHPTNPSHPKSIIITGSKQGITNPPMASNPAYNASKATLKSLTEHLAHDLRSPHSPSHSPHISVHLLIPGWTYTSLAHHSGPEPDLASKPPGAWTSAQVADYAYAKIVDEKAFYILCPDNDVSEEVDQARMLWAAGDVVEARPALSRWSEEWQGRAGEWIQGEAERRRRRGKEEEEEEEEEKENK